MKLTKLLIIRIMLYGASVSYVIGAIAHFFGLTLFPWYLAELYSPYHDSLIPLMALSVAVFMFGIAWYLEKYPEIIKIVIGAGVLAVVYSVAVLIPFDYAAFGAPEKTLQTIVETAGLVVYVAVLIMLSLGLLKSKNNL